MKPYPASATLFLRTFVWLGLTTLGVLPLTQPAQAAASAAWAPFDLPQLQQRTIQSATGAPYRIIVATPAGPAPAKGYPVIYVVDGNAWTGLVSEIIRANMSVGVRSRVEPAVVVGIGYPTTDAFDLKRRKLDLTSPVPHGSTDPDIGDGPTGGDLALMDFIDAVVKPAIGSRFKVDPTRQTLLGHSLGGLFTLRTMLNRPKSFQTYVALSPSIWWNHRAILQEARQTLAKLGRPANLRVFLSVGTLEQAMTPTYLAHSRDVAIASGETQADAARDVAENRSFYERVTMVSNARRMAALLAADHVSSVFVQFPGEDHFSVVPAALGRAVPFALADQLPAR